jgi:hypothetical protein
METNNNETKQQDERYVVLATKVSRHAAEQLARIARKKDMTIYELIQMVCDTLIRYMDDRHNLTAEMERAMSIFEHMVGWANAMNLADPTLRAEVAQAVYILQDTEGRKGFRAKMVSKPFCGIWDETSNVMEIFERIFNVCLPELYMKLFRAKIMLECNSVTEVINLLCDAEVFARLDAENRAEFEGTAKTEVGKQYQYGARTKAHGHRSPDSLAQDQRIKQGTIRFEEYDRAVAEAEAHNPRPHPQKKLSL